MADGFVPQLLPKDLTLEDSTQDTEPFPPGFVEDRLENNPKGTYLTNESLAPCLDWDTLSEKNAQQLDGARMLLYPKVKGLHIHPFDGNGSLGPWIDVKVKDKPTPAKVLVVAPGPEDVGCTASRHDAFFIFYFDPRQDGIFLFNQSWHEFSVTNHKEKESYKIKFGGCEDLTVGTWNLVLEGESILEIQVLSRKDWPITQESKKRAAPDDSGPPTSKKLKISAAEAAPTNVCSSLARNENSLVKIKPGMKICIGPREKGYSLMRLDTIFENNRTAVWRARHSSDPNRDIVVKVAKIYDHFGRSTARVARRWTREYTLHSYFDHPSIVKLLGYDARFHSLYLESINAKSLSRLVTPEHRFMGSHEDAQRIFENLASALVHVHGKSIVHADIKPGNILYSPDRGAVLIDFGLSVLKDDLAVSAGCGTSWYLPPEYMENGKIEGEKSDIWALGVTMSWLLGYMSLPETMFKPWNLRHINPRGTKPDDHQAATTQMLRWLKHVGSVRNEITKNNPTKLGSIIVKTLSPKQSDRFDAETLCKELCKLRLTASEDSKTPTTTSRPLGNKRDLAKDRNRLPRM